ncbi:hypothetical protein FB107DRAFT_269775 [Schizophyllum commune]
MAHRPVSKSSPFKLNSSRHNRVYQLGDMDKSRDAFVDDIGSVLHISVDEFRQHFMPPSKLDEEQLGQVFSKLCTKWRKYGRITQRTINSKKPAPRAKLSHSPYDGQRSVWTDFALSPSKRLGDEKSVYSSLVGICDQVTICSLEVCQGLQPMTQLVNNGSKPLTGSKYNSSPTDAYHRLLDGSGGGMEIYDAVCVVQLKKIENVQSTQDNDRKVIWDQHQIMRTDPRRRFTLGMTFYDTNVRLWHYNREALVVSDAFDFNQDCNVLIDVYARLSFATMPELGFDMSMILLPYVAPPKGRSRKQVQRQYRIALGGTYYITTETIADYCPEDGFGRCTRIFAAYEEGKSRDEQVVIKDCWIEASRKTEYEILKEIRADILAFDWKNKCHPPLDKVTDLNSYTSALPIDPRHGTLTPEQRLGFFVPILYGEKVKVDGREDDTQEVIANKYVFSQHRALYPVGSSSVIQRAGARRKSIWHGTLGNEASLQQPKEKVGCFFRPIIPRAHHRLVMKKGRTLSSIENARDAFKVLSDASYGVFMLHCVQWIHRDLSADNILAMPDGGGVLADLEYTKLASDPKTRSFRTGTPDFIALEVATRNYLSPSADAEDSEESSSDDDSDSDSDDDMDDTSDNELAWRYRDIHDLESLWWLCLWLLFRHTTDKPSKTYNLDKQALTCAQIFPGCLSITTERKDILTQRRVLKKTLRVLPAPWRKALKSPLNRVRKRLCKAYFTIKKRGKPLHPGLWWIVHRMCVAGQAIEGPLVWITDEQMDEVVKAQEKAKTRANATAKQAEDQTAIAKEQAAPATQEGVPADSAPRDVTMADADGCDNRRRSPRMRNKRKTRDDPEPSYEASSASEDGSPTKKLRRGGTSRTKTESRSPGTGRDAPRFGGKHAARRDGARG